MILDSSVFTEVKDSSVLKPISFLFESHCGLVIFIWWALTPRKLSKVLSGNFTINCFLGFSSFSSVAFPNVPQYCSANCASRQRKFERNFLCSFSDIASSESVSFQSLKKGVLSKRSLSEPSVSLPVVLLQCYQHTYLSWLLRWALRCLCDGFLYQRPKLSLPTGRQRGWSRPFLFCDECDFRRELCCSPNFRAEIGLEKNNRTFFFF